jgi:hypothetical protein
MIEQLVLEKLQSYSSIIYLLLEALENSARPPAATTDKGSSSMPVMDQRRIELEIDDKLKRYIHVVSKEVARQWSEIKAKRLMIQALEFNEHRQPLLAFLQQVTTEYDNIVSRYLRPAGIGSDIVAYIAKPETITV